MRPTPDPSTQLDQPDPAHGGTLDPTPDHPTAPSTDPTPGDAQVETSGRRRHRIAATLTPKAFAAAAAACVGAVALVGSATGASGTPATAGDRPLAAAAVDIAALTQRAAETERESARASRASTRMAVPASLAAPEITVTGKRWTTTALKVRTSPDEDADVVAILDSGDRVKITDAKLDGWRQVSFKGEGRWVKAAYLSKDKPEPAVSAATCPDGSGLESGLADTTVRVHRAVCHAFPSVSSYGGIRGSGGNHGTGHALDIMVSGGSGDDVAAYVRAHAGELGVTEVIWHQRIWTTQRSREGWRSMSDRGSATANHMDHVHVSTR